MKKNGKHNCGYPVGNCDKCLKNDLELGSAFDLLFGKICGMDMLSLENIAKESKHVEKLTKEFKKQSERWLKWQKESKRS